ncbi:MAG: ferrous iron transport protein A [Microthrixaceae bacterium]|nr:ferrous iron transport protein A [Microthrixaceae bacterium]
MVKLTEVEVGRDVVVRSVRSTGTGLGTRLEHIGFLPGTRVHVERRAPLGDPTVYELRGFRVAVRRESAELVDVDDAHSEEAQSVDVTHTGDDATAAEKAQAIEEARR